MSLKNKIFDVLKSIGKPSTPKEISEHIEDKPLTTIRGRIYNNLDKVFIRVDKSLYWIIEENESAAFLVNGDGRKMSELEDNSIHAIITDHPWLDTKSNVGGNRKFTSSYQENCFEYTLEDFKEKYRVLKPGSFCLEFLPAENESNFEYLYAIKQMAIEAGFQYYALVDWKKGNFVANTGRKSKNTESILFLTKGKPRNLRLDAKKIKQTGIMHYMSGTAGMLPTDFDIQPTPVRQRIHQSEKPVELFCALIDYVTLPGEWIVDQFSGSAHCGMAAILKKRFAIMYEKSLEMVDKWRRFKPQEENILGLCIE